MKVETIFGCWISLVHEGEGHAAAGSIPHMHVTVHTCNAGDLALAADAIITVNWSAARPLSTTLEPHRTSLQHASTHNYVLARYAVPPPPRKIHARDLAVAADALIVIWRRHMTPNPVPAETRSLCEQRTPTPKTHLQCRRSGCSC